MVELEKKFTTETLLEKIPAEKCWAITARILTKLVVARIHRARIFMGIEKGIISPVWGWEKYEEINTKIWAEGGKRFLPWVKQMFNIPVEDAVGAANLVDVVGSLTTGPEGEFELSEESRERVVVRWPKCPFMERYKEEEIDLELTGCDKGGCQSYFGEGLKAINPKLTFKLTKAMPSDDPYCECVIEFKEE